MRGSFPAPHHHDPKTKTLPNFQMWVMVVFPSPVTAGERLRYQRLQTLRRPCYRLLRYRSVLGITEPVLFAYAFPAWAFDVESLTVESCSLAEVVAPSKVAKWSEIVVLAWTTQPIRVVLPVAVQGQVLGGLQCRATLIVPSASAPRPRGAQERRISVSSPSGLVCREAHTHKLPSGMSERTEVPSGTPRAQGCLFFQTPHKVA